MTNATRALKALTGAAMLFARTGTSDDCGGHPGG
jgi:hypothetical protein